MDGIPLPKEGTASLSPFDWQRLSMNVLGLKYVSLAVMTTLLWDVVTTMDQEASYVYGTTLSTVTVLWFLNRILVPVHLGVHLLVTLMTLPGNKLCSAAGHFMDWMGVLNLFVIQAALAKRVVAIYEQSRLVVVFVVVLLFGSTLSRIILLVINPTIYSTVLFNTCLPFQGEIDAAAFYGPLIFDATLFVMTIARLRPRLRHSVDQTDALLVLLYRDGAIYFFVVALAMAMGIIGFFRIALFGPFTESFLYLGIVSVACSRMILNLRDTAHSRPANISYQSGLRGVIHIEMTRTTTTL